MTKLKSFKKIYTNKLLEYSQLRAKYVDQTSKPETKQLTQAGKGNEGKSDATASPRSNGLLGSPYDSQSTQHSPMPAQYHTPRFAKIFTKLVDDRTTLHQLAEFKVWVL